MGGVPTGRHSMHAQQRQVSQGLHFQQQLHTESSEAGQKGRATDCSHRNTHSALYVEGIFSAWPTDGPQNNEQDC